MCVCVEGMRKGCASRGGETKRERGWWAAALSLPSLSSSSVPLDLNSPRQSLESQQQPTAVSLCVSVFHSHIPLPLHNKAPVSS